MSEIIETTGRRMSQRLQHALDDVTGDDRRRLITVLSDSDSPLLGALHRALALELQLQDLREADTLRLLSRDVLEDLAEPPLPQAEGEPWWPDGGAA